MPLLDSLTRPLRMMRGHADITAAYTGGTVDPSAFPIASPWSTSTLERIVADDIFGTNRPENTRAAAMRIPAVRRARNLIVSTICRLPMVQLGRGDRLPDLADTDAWNALYDRTPPWLYRTVDGSSPQHRLAWTIDDLLFFGWSCWWRTNRADSEGGFPLDAGRINQGDWWVDGDNQVVVNGIPQADDDVILIPGLDAGILTDGRDILEDARQLYALVKTRLKNPVAATELHQVSGPDLTKPEQDELIAGYVAARERGDNIGYTSRHIELKVHGENIDNQLAVEARNAMAVDLARLVNLSAGLLDATTPKASLNYETKQGRNEEFADRDLFYFMTPITARFSLDDVMPRGQRAAFDLRDLTGPVLSPTGPDLQD